jgi:GDP-mannose 6-dehydrogenase
MMPRRNMTRPEKGVTMRIAIFGVGYVGAVSAACLARDGHQVIAVDVDEKKLADIAAGSSPIVEPGLNELIGQMVAEGRITTTTSADEAVAATDMSFVCVGTPARGNGALDTRYVASVAGEIGAAIRKKGGGHAFVLRSTVLPGTMDQVAIPALEAASGMTAGKDFGIANYVEFLREGSAIADYDNPGAIVFGGDPDSTIIKDLLEMHTHFPVQPKVLSIRAAEAVKYTNNAWHALKISFANEIGLICKGLGVDSHDVMDVVVADKKLNISPAYLTPGYAFGGSCLPKDVRALRYRAKREDVDTPLLDAVLEANENQITQAYRMVTALGKRRVGMIGLSFKPETDDLRYSPLVELAERLIGRGYQVRIYDPIVRPDRLTGSNARYIQELLPHVGQLLCDDVAELEAHADVLVIGNRKVVGDVLPAFEARGVPLIDLVRVDRARTSDGTYQGIAW